MPRPPSRSDGRAAREALELTRRRRGTAARGRSQQTGRARTADEQGRWLLSRLIDWHRREDRPHGGTGTDSETWPSRSSSTQREAHRRASSSWPTSGFEHGARYGATASRAQETKLRRGQRTPSTPTTARRGPGPATIVAIDDWPPARSTSVRGPKRWDRHPVRLLPATPIQNNAQRAALGMLAECVIEHGVDADGPSRAGA